MASRTLPFLFALCVASSLPTIPVQAGDAHAPTSTPAAVPSDDSGNAARAREAAILGDEALFPPATAREARPHLARILTSAGQVEERTLPLTPPYPTLRAVLQAHGAPDHAFRHGGGHVHMFGHLGLVAGDPGDPDRITAIWLQGRDFAYRATVLAGNTFRESTTPGGRHVRTFQIRGRDAARWEREREGVWREVGGSLQPGIYRRHWDEADAREEIHVTEAGIERRLFYRNGSLYQILPFRNHAWHGTSRVFYPSGRVEREMPLHTGRLHGDVVTYAPDGTVMARIPYRMAVRHGVSREYHPNGATRHAIPYEDGVIHGTAQHYSLHGRLIRETPFVQGSPSGVEKEYGVDGTLRRTQLFRDGVAVGEPTRFSRQGRPLPRMAAEDFGEIDAEILASPAEARARQRVQDPAARATPEADAPRAPSGADAPPGVSHDQDGSSDDPGLTRRVWNRLRFRGGE